MDGCVPFAFFVPVSQLPTTYLPNPKRRGGGGGKGKGKGKKEKKKGKKKIKNERPIDREMLVPKTRSCSM